VLCGTDEKEDLHGVISVISTDLALALVRVVVGLVIAAHGAQKVLGVWVVGPRGMDAGRHRMGLRPPSSGRVSAFAELAGGIAFAVGSFLPVVARR